MENNVLLTTMLLFLFSFFCGINSFTVASKSLSGTHYLRMRFYIYFSADYEGISLARNDLGQMILTIKGRYI